MRVAEDIDPLLPPDFLGLPDPADPYPSERVDDLG
jgi:hypothetical protein